VRIGDDGAWVIAQLRHNDARLEMAHFYLAAGLCKSEREAVDDRAFACAVRAEENDLHSFRGLIGLHHWQWADGKAMA